MKLILDSENSHPTTITVKGKEIKLLLIESSILIEGPAYYYFKKEDETDLIDVIVRVAIGKHREWIHNRNIKH